MCRNSQMTRKDAMIDCDKRVKDHNKKLCNVTNSGSYSIQNTSSWLRSRDHLSSDYQYCQFRETIFYLIIIFILFFKKYSKFDINVIHCLSTEITICWRDHPLSSPLIILTIISSSRSAIVSTSSSRLGHLVHPVSNGKVSTESALISLVSSSAS